MMLLSLITPSNPSPTPDSLEMVQNVYSHLLASTAAPVLNKAPAPTPVPTETSVTAAPVASTPLTHASTAAPNEAWLRQMFKDVVENMNTSKSSYDQYFSRDYIQHTNGRLVTYPAFVTHMQAQKASLQGIHVEFDQIVVEGNHIATIHMVTATKPNGTKVRAKVMAFFTIENHKIIACDEVTLPMA